MDLTIEQHQPATIAPPVSRVRAPGRSQQTVLVALIFVELLVFGITGRNFLTLYNAAEVLRLGVELGLIALALTPVIVTGGIDLSVGSTLALVAVVFGKLWRDGGLSPPAAAAIAIGCGAAAGLLNALFVTRLRVPALIVTLGTFSLYRGIAEGMTRGVDNFTNFPARFLFLGQGYIAGIPAQALIFIVAAVAFWILLHRSTIGRALSAIGYSPAGARYAAIAVERNVGLTYVLSGLCAAIAAIIYVAHWGQAKSDAGTGFELEAITAVVLGGTSIFGGRGSISGTLLGLLAIALLKNGLSLSDWGSEWASVLTGLLLLGAIGIDRAGMGGITQRVMQLVIGRNPGRRDPASKTSGLTGTAESEEFEMRNSQVTAVCAVILIAALIVVGGNFLLVKSIQQRGTEGISTSRSGASESARTTPATDHPLTIAVMPKSKGNAYYIACHKGIDEAAKELGVNLIWDGPTDPDPAKQNEIVETWITRGVDAMVVDAENGDGIASVLRKARQHGIKVLTWDSDTQPDARDFFVNEATPAGIGNALMDTAAKVMGGRGEFAIISASLTAENMNQWQKTIEARRVAKYPDIKMVDLRPCDDLQPKAFDETRTILNTHPQVKLIMAICSPAVPGAAEAVKQSGRTDVKVIGLGLPNDNKAYVHAGITADVILWKTTDLGYLAVESAVATLKGTLKPGDTSMEAGRLGKLKVEGTDVLLGEPFVFTKENIDQYDF